MTGALRRRRIGRGLALSSILVVLVAGCSARPGPEPAPVVVPFLPSPAAVDPQDLLPDPDHPHKPNAAARAALRGGHVSYDEYQAAVQRLRS